MCVSTVWGRYHYVVDIFGGVVTGTLGYVVGKWLMEKREEAYGRRFDVERAEFSLVRQ
jgi:membrane-associated phospholipid phosphatase